MRVHIYRNRQDDHRTKSELHFCIPCGGWYGVPHEFSHCQERVSAHLGADMCACRFCCEQTGRPVEGPFGFFSSAKRWQPSFAGATR